MALINTYEDARIKQTKNKGHTQTRFFDTRDNPSFPLASLNAHAPGYFGGTHFHIVDQFQVVVEGKGTLGKHDVSPYCVHFSRAYTPYGPLVGTPNERLHFFVMRAHPEYKAWQIPEELEVLRRVPNRQPWQITRRAIFPLLDGSGPAAEARLEQIPNMHDEQGLAAYTLTMSPNGKTAAPDPSRGEGQYLLVVKGGLIHEGKEQKAPALIFVYPNEQPFQLTAAGQGLEAIVLNFPKAVPRAAATATSSVAPGFKKWQCVLCSFSYDEALGLPDEGIPAGTRWEDVPATWTCPDCSTSKSDFEMVEV